MRNFIGLLMIIAGIILGLYVGVVVCFVGGITQIIVAITTPPVLASPIAWGVAKIVFAGLAGWVCAIALILPGFAMLKD